MPSTASISSRIVRTLGCMLIGTTLCLSVPDARAWHGPRQDEKRQIEQLEAQWRTAQLAGDTLTLDKMLSEDYVGITMSGEVNTKTQQLNRIRNRVFVLTRLDLRDTKVKLLGQVAIVTVLARVEGTNRGVHFAGNFRYTRIYQHLGNGAWRITNFEATRIHPPHDELAQLNGGKTG